MQDIPTLQVLSRFDRLIEEMGLKMGEGCALKQQAELIREYYYDRKLLGPNHANAKWQPRFLEFAQARIALQRFVEAVGTLQGVLGLSGVLRKVLTGSTSQDLRPSQAKDALYELELAATFRLAGFYVELREPDIVASGNGLRKPLALACKFPSSHQQLHEHLSKGYRQITGQNMDGAVAIGLDLIFGIAAEFEGVPEFSRGGVPALEAQRQFLEKEMHDLIATRARLYPAERPVDGLLMTVTTVGTNASAPTLDRLETIVCWCQPANPLAADLEIVKQRIEALN